MAAHTLPRRRLVPADIESHGAGTKERISEMKLAAQFYEEHLGLRFESIKGKRQRVIVALVGRYWVFRKRLRDGTAGCRPGASCRGPVR